MKLIMSVEDPKVRKRVGHLGSKSRVHPRMPYSSECFLCHGDSTTHFSFNCIV